MAQTKITSNTGPTVTNTGDLYYATGDSGANTISWGSVIDPVEARMGNIEKVMEKIMERLAVLDDPSPEKLAQFKALKEAYTKYKFLEALCGEAEDDNVV